MAPETENRPWLICDGNMGVAAVFQLHHLVLRWRCRSFRHTVSTCERAAFSGVYKAMLLTQANSLHINKITLPLPSYCLFYS